MPLGDVVDELHDEHGLAHTSTTEQANLSAFHVGLEQVDHLDTRREHLFLCGEFLKLWCLPMDGISTFHVEFFHAIDRLADDIEHPSLDLVTGWHQDRTSCSDGLQSTLQTVGIVHGDTPHGILTNVLLHLYDEVAAVGPDDFQRIMDFWQHFLRVESIGVVVNVDHRTDNLGYVSIDL